MKTIQTRYILALAILFSLGQYSCNKGLNLKPLDTLADATYWQTPSDFKTFANQYYAWTKNFTTLSGISDNPHSDGRSDLFGGGGSFGAGTNAVPGTEPGYGNAGNWGVDYGRIRATNYLLNKATTYATPAAIAQYVAEARFFRAFVYFDLLQLYGAVPLITSPLSTDSTAALYAPRTSRDSIVDFIIADLQAAIPNLPLSIVTTSADYGRVTQMTGQAFLARVALYEGTWQKFRSGDQTRYNALLDKAIAASNAVIASNQFALFGTAASNALGGNSTILGDSAQKYLFILENIKSNPANVLKSANHEYIFATRYDNVQKVTNNNISHSASVGVNRKIVNMYLCKDGLPIELSPLFQGYSTFLSEYQNRDNRMKYTLKVPYGLYWSGNANYRIDWVGGASDKSMASGPLIPTGYSSQKWITERQCPDYQESEDYPVIRYAEVLLVYAEAVFERNGAISDADLDKSLNLVRLRINTSIGMPKLSNAFVTANGLDMRTEIRRERTLELFNEDFRTDDIKRWHSAATDLVSNVGGTAYGNASQFVSAWPVSIKWTGTQYQTGPNAFASGSGLPKDANGCIITDQTARQFSEKNYLLPIPSVQITLNPALGQNPGWQ